jgi:hypothetical protein
VAATPRTWSRPAGCRPTSITCPRRCRSSAAPSALRCPRQPMGVCVTTQSDSGSGGQAPDRRRVRPVSGRLEDVQKVLTRRRQSAVSGPGTCLTNLSHHMLDALAVLVCERRLWLRQPILGSSVALQADRFELVDVAVASDAKASQYLRDGGSSPWHRLPDVDKYRAERQGTVLP